MSAQHIVVYSRRTFHHRGFAQRPRIRARLTCDFTQEYVYINASYRT